MSPGLWIRSAIAVFAISATAKANPKIPMFEALADEGDVSAMVCLGLIHHLGENTTVDHDKAIQWYLRAYENSDGDAYNNLGVMFRDGLGVEKNGKIAYLLFLTVCMDRLGSEAAQYRARRNLSLLTDALSQCEIEEALCYTRPYLDQVVRSRGVHLAPGTDVLPSADRPRFKDSDWWSEPERARLAFDPPAPWDVELADAAAR